jgi:hypothetical protein
MQLERLKTSRSCGQDELTGSGRLPARTCRENVSGRRLSIHLKAPEAFYGSGLLPAAVPVNGGFQ